MTKEIAKATLSILAVCLVLAACAQEKPSEPSEVSDPIAFLPAGAQMVMTLDMTTLRDDPLYEQIWNMIKEQESEQIAELEAMLGQDPSKILDRLAMGLYMAQENPEPSALLAFTLDPAKHTFSISDFLEEGQKTEEDYKGCTIVSSDAKDTAIASPAQGAILLSSDVAQVKKAIDTSSGAQDSIRADKALMAIYDKIKADAFLKLALKPDEQMLQMASSQAMMMGGMSGDMEKLDSMMFSISSGDRFDFEAHVNFTDTETAQQTKQQFDMIMGMIKMGAASGTQDDPSAKMTMDILSRLGADVSGSSVNITIYITREEIQTFIKESQKKLEI